MAGVEVGVSGWRSSDQLPLAWVAELRRMATTAPRRGADGDNRRKRLERYKGQVTY